jgi:hypothetical protein
MLKREAPRRIVPRVFAEDGGGYARPAKCVCCGKVISRKDLSWQSLVSDPPGVIRPVHSRCAREHQLFVMAFWSERPEDAPTL